ncbi:MAG: hypothetical protein ACLGH7_11370 [Actinomycetes bacterium]
MATLEEYKAVHRGMEPPDGLDAGSELGDGGCNVIYKDSDGVVGRWSSWESASRALTRLQKLGGRFEYRLEELHTWLQGPDYTATCSTCGETRGRPASGASMGIEWP